MPIPLIIIISGVTRPGDDTRHPPLHVEISFFAPCLYFFARKSCSVVLPWPLASRRSTVVVSRPGPCDLSVKRPFPLYSNLLISFSVQNKGEMAFAQCAKAPSASKRSFIPPAQMTAQPYPGPPYSFILCHQISMYFSSPFPLLNLSKQNQNCLRNSRRLASPNCPLRVHPSPLFSDRFHSSNVFFLRVSSHFHVCYCCF